MFRKRIQIAVWAINRLLFLFFCLSGLISAGVFCQIMAPLYSWYFFKDLNFTRYYRFLYPVMGMFYKYLMNRFRDPGYAKIFAISLGDAPRMDPDQTNLRLNPSWKGSRDSCDGCINCCLKCQCVFLNSRTKRCMSYGSFFWRYFNCGRYPASQLQIDHYQCPKWIISDCIIRENDNPI